MADLSQIRRRRMAAAGFPLTPYIIGASAPPLIADFANGVYGINGVVKTLEEVVPTHTCATVRNYVNSAGNLTQAAIDERVIDYDPVTLVARGLLLEDAATNLLLNSDTLATQTVTVVDATQYTLHFKGTGTITLSGADTSVLTGTGTGEANRVSVTFTTASTSLTATVSGTVSNAQLETGPKPSSYISSGGSATTRAAATASMDISVLALTSSFTVLSDLDVGPANVAKEYRWAITDGTSDNYAALTRNGANGGTQGLVASGGTLYVNSYRGTSETGVYKDAMAVATNDYAISENGSAVITDTTVALPTGANTLYYGGNIAGTVKGSARLGKLIIYDARLPDADLITASTA